MKNGRLQCKDIPAGPVLQFLAGLEGQWGTWFPGFENSVQVAMPQGMPDSLVLAKMVSLISRGLVDGCSCGCRGDFTATKKGRESIGLNRGPLGLEVS